MPLILAIDFEASCLPRHGRSYPIEVGIADPAGLSRAWLIRPHPDWAGWTWTAEAERLHGLDRATLARDGLPAAQVAAELAEAVGGRRVLSDSRLDAAWLATLCAAAGMAVPFAIGHVSELVDELAVPPAEVSAAVAAATRLVPGRHRAEIDALWVATLAADLIERAPPAAAPPLFPWAQAAERAPVARSA